MISLRFAIDHNRDRRISKEEHVSFEALAERDKDGDGALRGRELQDVYFEFGRDEWLEGGTRHRRSSEGYTQTIQLRGIKLDPPSIDMHVDIRA